MIFSPQTLGAPRLTQELRRVEALPRRTWSDAEAADLCRRFEALFARSPDARLFPLQAVALFGLGTVGGLFAPLGVGEGKTLIAFLAPSVTNAKRPLLVIPGELQGKTARDRERYAKAWTLPPLPVVTYQALSVVQGATKLESLKPDLLILDEAHRAKNFKDAACAKRLRRYLTAHPNTIVVCLSGTMTTRSLHDYAHLCAWCLGERSPVPLVWRDLECWAAALDEADGRQVAPGALAVLGPAATRAEARETFQRRLVETPGVVASTAAQGCSASIRVTAVEPPPSRVIDDAFHRLRTLWELPDGSPLVDVLEVYRAARQLALGFFSRWDPAPPKSWLRARAEWGAFVRKVLSHSRTLDTEKQVKLAHPDAPELVVWEAVRASFEPNPTPVWLCPSVLDFTSRWLMRTNGFVWTDSVAFGEAAAEQAGYPYHGAGGGEPLTRAVLSWHSQSEGRNLQRWSRNLVLGWPGGNKRSEQLMGRTHRAGQDADEVVFETLIACREHHDAFWKSHREATYVRQTTGAQQKLLLADYEFAITGNGPRWT
jgi:hypothetical protein